MAKTANSNEGKQVSRWASRRFLLAVAGLIVSVLVILGKIAPEETDAVVQVIVGAATLALSVKSPFGSNTRRGELSIE